MTDKAQRKELLEQYRQNPPAAGVYRITNLRTERVLVGSSMNLPSVRSKLEFARATRTTGGLDHRLSNDLRELGAEAFSFEVLEVLEPAPDRTAAQMRDDLSALEALWREQEDPRLLY